MRISFNKSIVKFIVERNDRVLSVAAQSAQFTILHPAKNVCFVLKSVHMVMNHVHTDSFSISKFVLVSLGSISQLSSQLPLNLTSYTLC